MSLKWPGVGVWCIWAMALWAAPPLSAAGLDSRPAAVAPGLQARDMAGRTHALEEYRGKVVLLNFWAS